MSDATVSATALTSQYISQVASDLERNVKEQERIAEELNTLQAELTALQHDHGVLVNMQQALGVPTPPTAPSHANGAAVPTSSGEKAASTSGRRRTAKADAVKSPKGKKPAAAKSATRKPAARKVTGPTLVDLIRHHLIEQKEPRSAAEVSKELSDAHPDRTISSNVVRTSLENLVARSLVQRNKQGSSVFYTASARAQATTEPKGETQRNADK
ncbi:BlaI/MecI/CopY family transcriptional regulator [Streptomyces sp. YKOK-J1]